MSTVDVSRWLESARFSDERIEALEELIIRKRSRLEGSKSSGLSDMPGGGGRGDWTNSIALIEGYEQELKRLRELREDVSRTIQELSRIEYVTALELYYLRNMGWAEVARAMARDDKTVRRWRDSAIEEIAKTKTGVW